MMLTFLQQFHFLRPLWWLALIPLVILMFFNRHVISGQSNWQHICDAHLLPFLLVGKNKKQKSFFIALVTCALIAIFALAGPAWRYTLLPTYHKQISRVILLDLSSNMLADDIKPSRITRAKFKIMDILNAQQEGLIGLIVYAGEPYVVSPLTDDAKTISAMIPELSPQIIPQDGNDLSAGLLKAQKMIEHSQLENGQIVVITSSPASKEALTKAKELAAKGYIIHVLGIGKAHSTPLKNEYGDYLHDDNGNILFSQFNIQSLQNLAAAGNGKYTNFTNTNADISSLLQDSLNNNAIRKDAKEHTHTQEWEDEGPWFIFLLLPFLLIAFREDIKQGIKTG